MELIISCQSGKFSLLGYEFEFSPEIWSNNKAIGEDNLSAIMEESWFVTRTLHNVLIYKYSSVSLLHSNLTPITMEYIYKFRRFPVDDHDS